ncbi:MAG: hypothetical protein R3F61_10685 [Myxococcota bacterium]
MRFVCLVLVGGCGLSEDAFRDEQAMLACERDAVCNPDGPDVDCSTRTGGPASTIITCRYDAEAAQACLDAIPAAECVGTTFVQPGACAQVFVDCQNDAG